MRRWRMRRTTSLGHGVAVADDAAIMLWWARRQLGRAVWTAPVGVYAIAVVWGLPDGRGAAMTLFAGVVWGYVFGVLAPQRLRRAICENARVLHVPEPEALTGTPPLSRVLVLTAVGVLAAVATAVATA